MGDLESPTQKWERGHQHKKRLQTILSFCKNIMKPFGDERTGEIMVVVSGNGEHEDPPAVKLVEKHLSEIINY